MVTVSLTTDWGVSGIYTGMFKAKLVQRLPGVQIVDVSHQIAPFDCLGAVWALKNAIPFFAPKTIHVVSVASKNIENPLKNREFICFQQNYQYFIGPNNGLWEMLFDTRPEHVYQINLQRKNMADSFCEADLFVDVIGKLSMGLTPDRIGEEVELYGGPKIGAPEIGENHIKGSVLYFDVYGNGITNVTKTQFEEIRKGRLFTIFVARQDMSTDIISADYVETNKKILALFNSAGLLELALPYMPLQSFLYADNKVGVWIKFFESENEKQNFRLI